MSLEKPKAASGFEQIKSIQEAIVTGIEEGARLAHEYFKTHVEIDEPLAPTLIDDGANSDIPEDLKNMSVCYLVKEKKLFINLDENNPRSLIHLLNKVSPSKDIKRKTRVISNFIAMHEYTHHIQSLKEQFVEVTFSKLVEIEAQADYYAGKVFNYHSAFSTFLLTRQDEDDILEFLGLVGSDIDIEHVPGRIIMDFKTEGGHDMGVIRKTNFLDGYNGVNNNLAFKSVNSH